VLGSMMLPHWGDLACGCAERSPRGMSRRFRGDGL
jgi:hypothetical protein